MTARVTEEQFAAVITVWPSKTWAPTTGLFVTAGAGITVPVRLIVAFARKESLLAICSVPVTAPVVVPAVNVVGNETLVEGATVRGKPPSSAVLMVNEGLLD